MSTATKILIKAIDELHIDYKFLDADEVFLQLNFSKGKHFIINNTLGLISNSDEKIAVDKAYQYLLLHQSIHIPKTVSYLDPLSKYSRCVIFESEEAIKKDMYENFSFPFIIKKNQGSEGVHVFKVQNADEIKEKIATIFDQKSSEYDYILLAQEYIAPKKEFRVIIYNKKISLAYVKDITHATSMSNLSPLHWGNARAVPVTDAQSAQLEQFILKLFTVWPIQYAGLDIIEDHEGNLWLIEVNAAPSVAYYVRDNGDSEVVKMYKTILSDLCSE